MREQLNSKQLSLFPDMIYEKEYEAFNDVELFRFRNDRGDTNVLTGRMLGGKVSTLGSKLQGLLKPQEKAVLLLPQGLEYIYSLLACFYANVTVIPTSVISIVTGTELTDRIMPVLLDSNATCIITDTHFKQVLKEQPGFTDITIVCVDEEDTKESSMYHHEPRKRKADDLALILYTSGSTALPKGVMLTHSNILQQARAGAEQWMIRQESRIVSWMPQFHNFGLFFNILVPLLTGASSVILPPDSFVKHPHLWFEMIACSQATHTAAPNFAFDYCCSSIAVSEVSGLSLGSLQAIICGGEAVRKESYEHFFENFQKLGLQNDIFCPHYGMSELGSATTLKPGEPVRYLSLDLPSLERGMIKVTRLTKKRKMVASCGEIGEHIRIVCVNRETNSLCLPNEVGEIWIKSPSIGVGYFNQQEETEQSFGGSLEESGETGFFRTGDLGFIQKNHLYIIGREKEVIIIHGKNYHPVDIEWTVKKNLQDITLPICVFSCEMNQQEKVIVVQEIHASIEGDATYKRIAQEIVGCVSETHGLEVYQVHLVHKGAIPKGGSGKVQRKKCRQLFQEQKLSSLHSFGPGIAQRQEILQVTPILDLERENLKALKILKILKILKNDIFQVIHPLDPAELEGMKSFSEFGLDSIKYVRISKRIEEVFQIQFAPVMLFKHRSIEALAQYLSSQMVSSGECAVEEHAVLEEAAPAASMEAEDTGIAVIGISCHFPGGSANTDLFWKNVSEGRDCISTISESRRQIIEDFRGLRGDVDEFVPQWGGFIADVDKFDAAFFGISPLEAESMDPQQRKMLELTWNVIEDGGYDPTSLAGSDVGLFVGVHSNDYAELMAQSPELMDTYGAYLDSGVHMSLITHRVSRWFDFHGPSEIINTACSSSLVALHHAIEALHRGECGMAVAGGINLILTSRIYSASHKAGMLSKEGRCKTFDEQADGFVRAEGYGAVLLKTYKEALKDKDTIYGVIKGATINHDGHSNSLRAPNLNAQKQLIKSAYQKADIPVETISFIETHGTGTALGDPIEIQALYEAFQEMSTGTSTSYCGLGTVKTVIGHCESAAGIASLIKVLLSMKEQTLPGILHFKKLNPYISLEQTPFYIVDRTRVWERLKNADGQDIPRRAGISSFGFGGANAHVIVEEFIPRCHPSHDLTGARRFIVPLSAKGKERLLANARQLLDYLEHCTDNEPALSDLAYTLQVGRTNMEERVVFLVHDIRELKEKISLFVDEKGTITDCWYGSVQRGRQQINPFGSDEDSQELIRRWFAKQNFEQIAHCWVQGGTIQWSSLAGNDKPSRINLPTYPFSKTRHWIPEADKQTNSAYKVGAIHPLLQQNTSDLTEQRFSTTFTGKEQLFTDHLVMGKPVLAGVAHLEMARAALTYSSRALSIAGQGFHLNDIVWIQPVSIDQRAVQVHIGLFPEENGQIAFEIYTGNLEEQAEQVVHSQGTMVAAPVKASLLDLERLKAACQTERLESCQLYDRFSRLGMYYGPSHRAVEEILIGPGIALAKLTMPDSVMGSRDLFVLHPSMLDAALQASSALAAENTQGLSLPFSIKHMEILGGCCPSMWARIEDCDDGSDLEKISKYNIELCDDDGNVRVRIVELAMVSAAKEVEVEPEAGVVKTLLFSPAWKEQSASTVEEAAFLELDHVLVLIEPEQDVLKEMDFGCTDARCMILQAPESDIRRRYENYVLQLLDELQNFLKGPSNRNLFIQLVVPIYGQRQALLGLAGLLRTASLENPRIIWQMIGVDTWAAVSVDMVLANSRSPHESLIQYRGGIRHTMSWEILQDDANKSSAIWKDGGVYLITGGMGGLGFLFAQEIVHQANTPTLILTGRSALDAEKKKKLRELEKSGAKVEYQRIDVAQEQAVHTLIEGIVNQFGQLSGIIHMAGVISDSYIIQKTEADLRTVLAAKVHGLVNLDRATERLALDFVIICSSIAGSLGNPGQSDYAAANAFMDYYAVYRNQLAASKQRSGHTVAVNWPLWEEGGMHVSPDIEQMMHNRMGMTPMKTSSGMDALYSGFASGRAQVMVIEGNEAKIQAYVEQQALGGGQPKPLRSNIPAVEARSLQGDLEEEAVYYFKNLLSSVIRLPAHEIDADQAMEKYGIDSIMVMQLTERLEKQFGVLPKTLFFEYQNIRALTGYFVEMFSARLIEIVGLHEEAVHLEEVPTSGVWKQAAEGFEMGIRKRARFSAGKKAYDNEAAVLHEEIAIIGLAGRYPGAGNIHEFWKNISEGKDSITEVPSERWDHSRYFDEDKRAAGKTYTKWGGFIDGVDRFDPLFFNISPKEAEMMDPQERLFLECVHEALEDAGYSRETLRHYGDGNVGVFVGGMFEEYQLYGAQLQVQGKPVAVSGTIASIANRVSYFYDFHGPSIAVDTMCSSSLTAIHLACQSLQIAGCNLAIAGGVNVSIHPNKYLLLGQGKFASSKGRCETFGQGGDGYVPGEGVGAVLLKPLTQAVKDGDHIYGIIKATAVNHGGKTNGYTVPNPNAQASVIGQALKRANLDPRSINYIEAHGTGTSLGDPIEIAGLTKAFQAYTRDGQFCAIGSVKSNIGHCESAAGIAGITKVLLQMKHGKLAPSLHSKVLNTNIDFKTTPFVVQQELAEWEQVVLSVGGTQVEYPRRAGISAFGAGGSNAHVVIEEYVPRSPKYPVLPISPKNPAAIILSAKCDEQLRQLAERLLIAIQGLAFSESDLASIAYTLQVGREAMEERLAMTVTSLEQLQNKLSRYLAQQGEGEQIYRGSVKRDMVLGEVLRSDDDIQQTIESWLNKRKYGKLLELWVAGFPIDWEKLYVHGKPDRIGLPTYPFARECYWLPEAATALEDNRLADQAGRILHPLLHRNTSNLAEQRFSSTFTGHEIFFRDHVVRAKKTLPGTAYLEMVRAAIEESVPEGERSTVILKHIGWSRPVEIHEQQQILHIGIYPEAEQEIGYEIYSQGTNGEEEIIVHCQGQAILVPTGGSRQAKPVDILQLRAECSQDISATECYERFGALGITYGSGHQAIEHLCVGEGKVLAKLTLPTSVRSTAADYILHPSMLDAAIQATLGFSLWNSSRGNLDNMEAELPFALEELEIMDRCVENMWAIVRKSGEAVSNERIRQFDIDLCDEDGRLLVSMKKLALKGLDAEHRKKPQLGSIMLEPVWKS